MSSEIDWGDELRPVRAVRHARHPVRSDDTSLVGLLAAIGALQQSLDAIAGRLDAIEGQLRGHTAEPSRPPRRAAPRRLAAETSAASEAPKRTRAASEAPKRTRAARAAPAPDAASVADGARRRPSPTRKR